MKRGETVKKIYGRYKNSIEARKAVEELMDKGYSRDQIRVISSRELDNDISYKRDNDIQDDRDMWEKIKDAFVFDKYDEHYWDRDFSDEDKGLVGEYKEHLQSGNTVIFVEEDVNVKKRSVKERLDQMEKEQLNPDQPSDLERSQNERFKDQNLKRNPLDKPYPENKNYQKKDLNSGYKEKEHLTNEDRRDKMIEKDVDSIDDIDKKDRDLPI